MKRLGIIGGLGPMATAYLMEQIINMTDAKCDQEHIEIVVFNMPKTPDRTAFILGKSTASPLAPMQKIAQQLAENGCEVLAMPCITAHYFHNELKQSTKLPLIHGIRECGSYLLSHNIKTIGVMATDGTITSNLFADTLSEFSINCIYPDSKHQSIVMDLIYNDVKAGKKINLENFKKVSEHLFNKGAQVIILGCTELSIIKQQANIGHGYLDIIDVIAQKAVISCGKLKEEFKEIIT